MADVLYTRTSSDSQEIGRQYEYFKNMTFDRIFEDEGESGKDDNRPAFQEMKSWLRSGDYLYVEELDRLGRDIIQLVSFIREMNERGVNLVIAKEGMDTRTDVGMAMVGIMGTIAELERKRIRQRQKEGIALARKNHPEKYKGGKPKQIDMNKLNEYMKLVEQGELSKSKVAKKLGISRQTLYNRLNLMKELEVV